MASSSMAPLLKRATANLYRPLSYVSRYVSVAAPSSSFLLRSFTRSAELTDSGVDEEKLNMLERPRSDYLGHRRFSAPNLYSEYVPKKSTLVIKGEGEKEADGHDEEAGGLRKYSRIDLPVDLFKIGEIKAVTKNGVLRELRFLLPKVKEDERKDVVEGTVQCVLSV